MRSLYLRLLKNIFLTFVFCGAPLTFISIYLSDYFACSVNGKSSFVCTVLLGIYVLVFIFVSSKTIFPIIDEIENAIKRHK